MIGWKKLRKLGMTPETHKALHTADKPNKYTMQAKAIEYARWLAKSRSGIDTNGMNAMAVTAYSETHGKSMYSAVTFYRWEGNRQVPMLTVDIPNWDWLPGMSVEQDQLAA